MPTTVAQHLSELRRHMRQRGLAFYLVPSTDEYLLEFPPPYAERRAAISGFDGSAGDALIGLEEAHLWVDSRYHIQAEQQSGGAFQVHKLGLPGVLSWSQWLYAEARRRGALRVGYDPAVLPASTAQLLRRSLRRTSSSASPEHPNLVDAVWTERPHAQTHPLRSLPKAWCGEAPQEKLARIRTRLRKARAHALVLTRLDEIAWTLNLRGEDIPHTPVFPARFVITRKEAVCYTDHPLDREARQALHGAVQIAPMQACLPALRALAQAGKRVWADADGMSEVLWEGIKGAARVHSPTPVQAMKAIKHVAEIERSHVAHRHAACAKVRAFSTLEAQIAEGTAVSEKAFAAQLDAEYARAPGFAGLSFPTIAAYGANSAIVHYSKPSEAVVLRPGGLLLVDSGVQLHGATTDDTRSVCIGQPTREQQCVFTRTLRAHIRLAMQIFPQGTTGQVLDALARATLWNAGLDYGHGTGHGVGAMLGVHEGPQSLTPRSQVPLEVGMIVSNEPGCYRPGWGGVRCENLYLVEEAPGLPAHPGGHTWLRLTPLTWLPFERRLITPRSLGAEERNWLNEYHRQVEERLGPHLGEQEHRHWLHRACAAL